MNNHSRGYDVKQYLKYLAKEIDCFTNRLERGVIAFPQKRQDQNVHILLVRYIENSVDGHTMITRMRSERLRREESTNIHLVWMRGRRDLFQHDNFAV